MTVRWEALIARCRGLASHLVSRDATLEMARATTMPALAAHLERAGMPVASDELDQPRSLERAVRASVGRELARLARWLDDAMPPECAAPLLDDEEVRSLRALLRGAAAGAPAEARLAGLVPTPTLPSRVLELLAREPRVAGVVATLRVLAHPYGAELGAVIDPVAEPDLARLEQALLARYAARVSAAAAHGDAALARWCADSIDDANLISALALARERAEGRWADAHLAGGRRIDRLGFERVVRAGEHAPLVASGLVAAAEPELARLLRESGADLPGLDDRLTRLRLGASRRRARLSPIGADTVRGFLLALRLQARSLSGLVWSVAMGAPPEWRVAALLGG